MIKPLTSLRFIFAFLVLLHHFTVDGISLFAGGSVRVTFFFLLSGFILTYRHKTTMTSGFVSKKKFWIGRFARIYPLHLATLIISCVFYIHALNQIPMPVFLANALLLQSFIPIESVFFSFNAVSWSLSCEAFFYGVFPFLIIWICRAKKLTLILTLSVASVLFIVSLIFIPKSLQHAFFDINPIFRLFDFLMGIGLYFLWEKRGFWNPKSVFYRYFSNPFLLSFLELSTIVCLIAFVFGAKYVPFVLTYSVYYWIPLTLIIFVFAQPENLLKKGIFSILLSNKTLVFLGKISFSFYMLHALIMRIYYALLPKLGLDFAWQINFVIILSIVMVSSIISYLFFEKPINAFAKKQISK